MWGAATAALQVEARPFALNKYKFAAALRTLSSASASCQGQGGSSDARRTEKSRTRLPKVLADRCFAAFMHSAFVP
jgi:hypothetical protein